MLDSDLPCPPFSTTWSNTYYLCECMAIIEEAWNNCSVLKPNNQKYMSGTPKKRKPDVEVVFCWAPLRGSLRSLRYKIVRLRAPYSSLFYLTPSFCFTYSFFSNGYKTYTHIVEKKYIVALLLALNAYRVFKAIFKKLLKIPYMRLKIRYFWIKFFCQKSSVLDTL